MNVLFGAVLAASLSPQASNWVSIVEAPNGDIYQVLASNISEKSGMQPTIGMRIVISAKNNVPWTSMVTQARVDCRLHLIRLTQLQTYDAQGKPLPTPQQSSSRDLDKSIKPGTTFAYIEAAVCP